MPNKNVTFRIAKERYFNNGKIMLNALPTIESSFRESLSKECTVTSAIRTPKNQTPYEGITADSINKALRNCIKGIDEIHGETHVENGIFFHSSKEGFDFSIYDWDYNLSRLYNYYLGSIGILNGNKKIIELYKKMQINKDDWIKQIDNIKESIPSNTDYILDKTQLTIAGEFQFGNWALVYRDLFRLLNADANPGIDFYIYITATGTLSQLISNNTVSYESSSAIIEGNLSILKTPIWLIGLDI